MDNESPKPPPRQKLNGTGTPVLFEPTALNHLEEENKKLKIEIEKYVFNFLFDLCFVYITCRLIIVSINGRK